VKVAKMEAVAYSYRASFAEKTVAFTYNLEI
jgi:hypothetical protein